MLFSAVSSTIDDFSDAGGLSSLPLGLNLVFDSVCFLLVGVFVGVSCGEDVFEAQQCFWLRFSWKFKFNFVVKSLNMSCFCCGYRKVAY